MFEIICHIIFKLTENILKYTYVNSTYTSAKFINFLLNLVVYITPEKAKSPLEIFFKILYSLAQINRLTYRYDYHLDILIYVDSPSYFD